MFMAQSIGGRVEFDNTRTIARRALCEAPFPSKIDGCESPPL